MAAAEQQKLVLKSLRFPVPLVHRVEAARKACSPAPTSQGFYTYLVERGLKDVEAPKPKIEENKTCSEEKKQ